MKIIAALFLMLVTLQCEARFHLYPQNVVYIEQHPTIYHPGYRYGERVYLRRKAIPMTQYYYVTPDRLAKMPPARQCFSRCNYF